MHVGLQGKDKDVYLTHLNYFHDELQRTNEGNCVLIVVVKVPCLMYFIGVFVKQNRFIAILVKEVQNGTIKVGLLLVIEQVGYIKVKVVKNVN